VPLRRRKEHCFGSEPPYYQQNVSTEASKAQKRLVTTKPHHIPFRENVDNLLAHDQGAVVENIRNANAMLRDCHLLVEEEGLDCSQEEAHERNLSKSVHRVSRKYGKLCIPVR